MAQLQSFPSKNFKSSQIIHHSDDAVYLREGVKKRSRRKNTNPMGPIISIVAHKEEPTITPYIREVGRRY